MEIHNLLHKELKIMVIKKLKLGRRMNEYSENFNTDKASIRKYQREVTELKNIITKLKNTLLEFNR